MSTTSGDVPGLLLPTVSGSQTCPPGQEAINTSTQTAETQVALSKIGGNKKRGGGDITVPQFSNDVSGANTVIAQTAQTSTQAAEYSSLDTLGGGKRRSRTSKRKRKRRRTSKRRTIKRRTRRTKK